MNIRQLHHTDHNHTPRHFPLEIICDNLRNPENIGMAFRVCEAFGIQKIWFCGKETPSISPKAKKVSRHTYKSIPHHFCPNILELINFQKQKKHTLIGLEITNQSQLIYDFEFTNYTNISLILGSERHGISPEVLQKIDHCVMIPFFGQNSSMNAINALSISLYEITKQLINA